MKYVLIIPARGGSKRLVNKNILPLNGIPLFAHSIIYAQQYLPNSLIWVSTDSEEIKKVSLEYGVGVIDRPEEFSTDTATTASVLEHASAYIKAQGVDYDYMIHLQPTQPVRPKYHMKEAMDLIDKNGYEALVSFSPILLKMCKVQNDKLIPWNYYFGQRSQDMEPLYYENGLLYITARSFIDQSIIFPENTYPFILDDQFKVIDIDTKKDFEEAEYYIDRYSKEGLI